MGCGPSSAVARSRNDRNMKRRQHQKPRDKATEQGGAFNSSTRAGRLSYLSNIDEDDATHASVDMDFISDAHLLDLEGFQKFQLQVACMSRAGCEAGFQKVNQDSYFAFNKFMVPRQSLFGCFDGHGPCGHLVSSYIKHNLPLIIFNGLVDGMDSIEILRSAFCAVDKKLTTRSKVDCEFSGSTAVVALLQDSRLHIGWVGDSRAVLGRTNVEGQTEAIDLSNDHKPTVKEERRRIISSSGRVERLTDSGGHAIGPYRVWTQNAWVPGLAMSRAIGDIVAHQVGVISIPDTCIHDIDEFDKFIILASDGVWEFIDSNEAVQIIDGCHNLQEGCRQLVDEAYHRWVTQEDGVADDVSAVIAKFIHA